VTRRATITILVLLAALALAAIARLLVGADSIHWPEDDAILSIRAQRVAAAGLAGAALAVAGVLLQSLLRNPLASPDLLGLASGGAFAVMLVTYIAYRTGATISPAITHGPAALVGALTALGVVYALAQRRGMIEPVSLILVGVIVTITCAAATTLIQSLMPPDPAQSAVRWLFGNISDEHTWPKLAVVSAAVAVCTVIALWASRAMDAAALSDDEARSVGVPLGALRLILFVTAGVLTAAAVVLAGPIGFVGLVCPHLVRMMAGPTHRPLVIGAFLAGAALLITADATVKGVNLASGRLPIGVLTALIGGPIFVVLLRRALR